MRLASGVHFFYRIGHLNPGKSHRISLRVAHAIKPFFAKSRKVDPQGMVVGRSVDNLYEIDPGPILFVLELDGRPVASCILSVAGAPVPSPDSLNP